LATPFHDDHIMTPHPSLLPGQRLIPELNLEHQVLATALILNLKITSAPSGPGLHWTPFLPSFCHMGRPYVR
jgi:hypothetical protein